MKTILSSCAKQKQAAYWICPTGYSLLTSDLSPEIPVNLSSVPFCHFCLYMFAFVYVCSRTAGAEFKMDTGDKASAFIILNILTVFSLNIFLFKILFTIMVTNTQKLLVFQFLT